MPFLALYYQQTLKCKYVFQYLRYIVYEKVKPWGTLFTILDRSENLTLIITLWTRSWSSFLSRYIWSHQCQNTLIHKIKCLGGLYHIHYFHRPSGIHITDYLHRIWVNFTQNVKWLVWKEWSLINPCWLLLILLFSSANSWIFLPVVYLLLLLGWLVCSFQILYISGLFFEYWYHFCQSVGTILVSFP